MKSLQKEKLRRLLAAQIERIERRVGNLERWDSKFSYIRLTYVLGGGASLYFIAGFTSSWFFLFLVLAAITVFIGLVIQHKKITDTITAFTFLKQIKREHLARMNLTWDQLPERPVSNSTEDHSFANDLNITGSKSLLQLMDTSIYKGSRDKLVSWLLEEHPDESKISKRRELVRELSPRMLFRDRLRVKAFMTKSRTSEKDWSMDQLLTWLSKPRKTSFMVPIVILAFLALLNVVLGIAWMTGLVPPYAVISFTVYLVVYNSFSDKVKGLFESAYQMDNLLRRFRSILLHIENFSFGKSTALTGFCEDFQDKGRSPSYFLKKVTRISGPASLQQSQVVWLVVNAIVPWDLFFSYKMEKLKAELEPRLSRWLDIFYELEALNSLANFSWLNPDYIFTNPHASEELPLEAEALGHPLIPDSEKVVNDFTVEKEGSLFLITGSNMAGKSTFLRTVGINLCLCYAGAPVNARSFKARLFRLFTSINVKDSLGDGISHFYAEVKRLKKLLIELEREDKSPLFFFVDEIFKGTNNRERLQGSTAFLKEVAGCYGVGMISTHDLELASLEEEIPELQNRHFEETIEDGKMSFEYKLKPGPCPTTNALTIMKMEGLPV